MNKIRKKVLYELTELAYMVIPSSGLYQNSSTQTHTYTIPHKNATQANEMINCAPT